MRPSLIVPLLLFAACASPAPRFMGATRHDISLGGIDFVVFQKDGAAEVIRMGYLSRDERAVVPVLMTEAAERTTGCRVRPNSVVAGIPGDTTEARMSLDC
jgi:hypothetical protein